MFKNPDPQCQGDCKFSQASAGSTTLAYYPPVYDKNGVNINPDRNETRTSISCSECNRVWIGSTVMGRTEYNEIIKAVPKTVGEEDVEYFRAKVEHATTPEARRKHELQLAMLEDAVVIYKVTRKGRSVLC